MSSHEKVELNYIYDDFKKTEAICRWRSMITSSPLTAIPSQNNLIWYCKISVSVI